MSTVQVLFNDALQPQVPVDVIFGAQAH